MNDQDWDDYNKGRMGIPTGTPINEIGLGMSQQRQQAIHRPTGGLAPTSSPTRPSTPGHRSGSVSGGGYAPLELTQRVLDAMPRWILIVCGILGAAFGLWIAMEMSAHLGWWRLLPVAGMAAVGAVLPKVVVHLVDFAIQLTWGLIKLALILGTIALAGYVLMRAFGHASSG